MSNAVIGALRVTLGADTAAFDRGLKQAKGGMTGIEQAAKRMGAVLAGAFSTAAIMRGVQGAVSAFASFERQQLITQQVLQSTGFAAGRTAEQLERLARQIGSATLASTQQVRDAANQLLTFRSIAGDTFDRTLRAAQDLATVGFGSLSSTTQQLAKALEDPINGLNALRRAGVSFSDEQRRVIRAFVESGDAAAAQNEILKAVEAQVGGAGAAAGGGLAGAYDTLSEEIKLFVERTGAQIAALTQLESVMKSITGLLAMDRSATDPMNQLMERIDRRAESIERMRRAMETAPAGMATLQREQLAALEAAQATDQYALAQLRLRQGMEELNATRRSEIAQEEIRRASMAATEDATERVGAAMRRVGSGMSEIGREVARIYEATRTPLERFNKEAERLKELLKMREIDTELFGRAMNKLKQDLEDATASGANLASTLSSQFANVFSGLISGTQRAGQAIGNLLQQLGQLLINKAFNMLFSSGGAGGFLSGIGRALGFGGARAMGGPVSSSKSYLIGERGPELFVPNTSGTVIPNHALGGAGSNDNISITLEILPSGEFEAMVAGTSQRVAVNVVKANNKQIPGIVANAQRRGA